MRKRFYAEGREIAERRTEDCADHFAGAWAMRCDCVSALWFCGKQLNRGAGVTLLVDAV